MTNTPFYVLVACEESQVVASELRQLGHYAFSCDLQPCSGDHPQWHIKDDVLRIINGRCSFETMDGVVHHIDGPWDLLIAHPPCTYLSLSGNRWFNIEKYGEKAVQRHKDREAASAFFMAVINADCPRIAVENPVGIMNSMYRKPDQIIQPWQFALSEDEKTVKTTCLWLKGLEPLVPLHHEKPELVYHEWQGSDGRVRRQNDWYYKTRCMTHSKGAKVASKTFRGVGRAMAEQWAGRISV